MNHVMPRMSPLRIETKGLSWMKAWWVWLTTTRKWILDEDWYFYIVILDISVMIPKGFIFDGASIPKFLRMFFSPVGILLLPGILHDFGYKNRFLLLVNDITGETCKTMESYARWDWDILFRDVAIQVNGFEIINRGARFALVIFGGFAWRGHRKNDTKTQIESIMKSDKEEYQRQLKEGRELESSEEEYE